MTPERVAQMRAYRAKGLAPLRSDMDDLLDAYRALERERDEWRASCESNIAELERVEGGDK